MPKEGALCQCEHGRHFSTFSPTQTESHPYQGEPATVTISTDYGNFDVCQACADRCHPSAPQVATSPDAIPSAKLPTPKTVAEAIALYGEETCLEYILAWPTELLLSEEQLKALRRSA